MKDDGIGAAIAIGILFIWLGIPPKNIHDLTIYYRYCPDLTHNPLSCPEPTKVMKIKYRLFLNEQFIISQSAQKTACSIFDEKNWRCEDKYNTMLMNNGDYFETNSGRSLDKDGNESTLPRYQNIPVFAYYLQKCIEFFR